MKRVFALGLVALSVSGMAVAEQNPPQAPVPPHVEVHPDVRHHDARGFEMRFGGMDEGARILPPGAWWKDADLAKRIELTPDQQKRIDDTFLQSKIELIHQHASLEEEELLLEPLLNANPIDQGKTLTQISKIADTRAALEKSNAKMLLQIRGVLTQTQWTKLQQERPGGMRQRMLIRAPEGPHSFNLELPDLQALRDNMKAMPQIDTQDLQRQMNAMPKIDAEKLRTQIQTMPQLDVQTLRSQLDAQLKAMPPIDPAKLRKQIDAALLAMPKIDVEKLREQMLQLMVPPPLDTPPAP